MNHLRAQGVSIRSIGKEMGISPSLVHKTLADSKNTGVESTCTCEDARSVHKSVVL